jgi:hypothetical protein
MTFLLIFALLKRDTIHIVSSRNFRMKLLDSNYPVIVIIGGTKDKNYQNPAFLQWVKTHIDGSFFALPRKVIFISDDDNVPSSFSGNYNHIVVQNASGEIYFDIPQDTIKTSPISKKERTKSKMPFKKEYIVIR